MKIKVLFVVILVLFSQVLFSQNNQSTSQSSTQGSYSSQAASNGTASSNSQYSGNGSQGQGKLRIYSWNCPILPAFKPIPRFKGWLRIKAWRNWNNKRKNKLKLVNPTLPFPFYSPLKSKLLSQNIKIIPGPVRVIASGSVTDANSASLHHSILRDDSPNYGVRVSKKHNFILVIDGQTRPNDDFKLYAKVYVNKKFLGTTSKGLVTQRKVFRTNLKTNKHLLKVKIIIQDKYQMRWRQLLNTAQPRAKYFPVKRGNITIVKITYKPNSRYKKYAFTGRFVPIRRIEDYNNSQ